MSEYFAHDYHTRNKKKLLVLIDEYKMAGYGLFWVIVEMLYEGSEKWLDLDRSTYVAVSKESGESVEFVEKFIRRGISEFKVFIQEGEKFSTERVLAHIRTRLEIREVRSRAGKASAAAKQNSTRVKQTPTIKVKESKGNKRKEKKNTVFVPPTENQVREYFKENGYSEASALTAFKYYSTANWHDRDNKPVKNWKQKMISVWFTDKNKIAEISLFSAGGSGELSAREKHDQKFLD